MKSKPSLLEIKKDLKHLNTFDVVIYGSYADEQFTPRSDIDIAIITKEKNPEKNKEIWKNALKKTKQKYHLNIFELLPLPVKMDIIKNHLVLFGNTLNLSEHFYHYRKLWKDVKQRYEYNQFKNIKEKMEKLKLLS